jgi:hypothetical protein
VVSGTATLGSAITTSGLQTYSGAVTLITNTSLNTTDSLISFGSTLDGAYTLSTAMAVAR